MERTKGLLVVFPFNLLSVSVVWSCFDFLSVFPLLPWAVACPLPWGSNNSPPHCWVAEQTSTLSLRSWKPALSSLLLALFSGGGSTRLCFLGKQLWTLFSQSLVSQTLIFAHWPSPLHSSCSQLLTTSYVASCLRCSSTSWKAATKGRGRCRPSAVACGLGLWSESMTGSFGKCVCLYFWNQWAKSRTSNEQSTSTTSWSCFIFFTLPIAYRIVRIKKKKSKLRAMQVKEKRKGLFSEPLNLETPPDSAS